MIRDSWHAVCADAELGNLRLHDVRHAVASRAVTSGENPPSVDKALGSRRHGTTASYANIVDPHLVEATEEGERSWPSPWVCSDVVP